jgi:hypothetical protein
MGAPQKKWPIGEVKGERVGGRNLKFALKKKSKEFFDGPARGL